MIDTITRDRCDRCGAAGRYVSMLPGGGLLVFCGHHERVHREGLRAGGALSRPLAAVTDGEELAGVPTSRP
ncbi:hypothetical protein [Actinomycetospora sp. TBRC 11914]|uniref:DUF7455 domain-containing protein n=1 Tax=Actinomycetospora sp. TBRC 11914 TaxID=2729387 RepID=UPI00145F1434|nr:hypothetical protein [Actinomycetospora sp. TBRC 11914]NMO93927.1 hypothetical protein [Actinomycetospora sp. TBRC 11914]